MLSDCSSISCVDLPLLRISTAFTTRCPIPVDKCRESTIWTRLPSSPISFSASSTFLHDRQHKLMNHKHGINPRRPAAEHCHYKHQYGTHRKDKPYCLWYRFWIWNNIGKFHLYCSLASVKIHTNHAIKNWAAFTHITISTYIIYAGDTILPTAKVL